MALLHDGSIGTFLHLSRDETMLIILIRCPILNDDRFGAWHGYSTLFEISSSLGYDRSTSTSTCWRRRRRGGGRRSYLRLPTAISSCFSGFICQIPFIYGIRSNCQEGGPQPAWRGHGSIIRPLITGLNYLCRCCNDCRLSVIDDVQTFPQPIESRDRETILGSYHPRAARRRTKPDERSGRKTKLLLTLH